MPTIIPDVSPIFPNCPSFGYVAEPNYLVKITAREGGFERRQRVWARPLTNITASPTGDQPNRDIELVRNFWHAMGGLSSAFRATDWTDYKSCFLDETPAATDMPLVASGDSPSSFRLVKQYVVGSIIQEREILKPNGATILIANEVGAAQTDWTLDESTGLVTIGGGFSGTPTSWGGEFYLWCRFNAQLNPTISNWNTAPIMNVTVQLAEIRLPLP
jgi:uncharacterized protein (TIGR02217 family)